jgi:hypothetical protein
MSQSLLASIQGEGPDSGLEEVRALSVLPNAAFCIADSGHGVTTSAGSAVVASTAVTTGSVVLLTCTGASGGNLSVGAISGGTNFTVVGTTGQHFNYGIVG